MAHKVKVIISNDQKKVKIPKGMRLLIRRCCTAVLVMEEFPQDAEISVSIVDSETDVLSFPLGENGVYDINYDTNEAELGDIVISLEKAEEQAKRYGHSLEREVGYLTVHSMLHLLGYDHELGGIELVRMREKEEKVLTELGLRRDGNYYMEDE